MLHLTLVEPAAQPVEEALNFLRPCKDFVTVCPGIRPANASVGDQKRVVTPKDAINKGAHYLVVGRPITKAENPSEAAINIAKEIENA